jgi:hypothetical protein
VTATSPSEGAAQGAPEQPAAVSPRGRLVESLFDNLALWTVIAAAISLLYLIWVTLDILGHYVRGIPKVGA